MATMDVYTPDDLPRVRHTLCSRLLRGEVAIDQGQQGQILAVLRDPERGMVNYEVLFGDRLLLVPESALCWPMSRMPLEVTC